MAKKISVVKETFSNKIQAVSRTLSDGTEVFCEPSRTEYTFRTGEQIIEDKGDIRPGLSYKQRRNVVVEKDVPEKLRAKAEEYDSQGFNRYNKRFISQ